MYSLRLRPNVIRHFHLNRSQSVNTVTCLCTSRLLRCKCKKKKKCYHETWSFSTLIHLGDHESVKNVLLERGFREIVLSTTTFLLQYFGFRTIVGVMETQLVTFNHPLLGFASRLQLWVIYVVDHPIVHVFELNCGRMTWMTWRHWYNIHTTNRIAWGLGIELPEQTSFAVRWYSRAHQWPQTETKIWSLFWHWGQSCLFILFIFSSQILF